MITPESEADVCEAVLSAKEALHIVGGNTRPIGQTSAREVLSVAGMTGIELYEPGALTIVAQAGTPLSEVQAALKAENQRLPFEPVDHRGLLGTTGSSTIGGVVAANVSGPRRIQAGACRDSLIGVRFVDGHGTAVKNGGRVMKNVTGYDLVKLMAGSFGTLGVLTEVAFKVLPDVETSASLSLLGLDIAAAAQAMSEALGSPFEVSGAAHIPGQAGNASETLLRIEGFEDSVAYRSRRLQSLLARFGDVQLETNATTTSDLWVAIRDVEPLQNKVGDIWRISVKPTDAPAVAVALAGCQLMYDWGGGLIWALSPENVDLRRKLTGISGHATRYKGESDATIPAFHPETEPLRHITDGLRSRFDPRGIFNPGLMN